MSDVSRRQALKIGAAGATGALLPLSRLADGPAPAAEAAAANDLVLWYDESAGTNWLRALPIGNGRLGAMVFGNVDRETLQLNEDTVWAGGPHDPSNTRGAGSIAEIRRRVFANQWTQAQDLINQTMLGNPVGQLAYQPVGNLRLTFSTSGSASQYTRRLDLSTATSSVAYVMNGVRHEREVFASAPDQVIVHAPDRRPGQLPHLHRHVRQPATHHAVQPGRCHDRARRHVRQPGGHHRRGPLPRADPRHRHRRQRQQLRRHAAGLRRHKRDAADLDRLQLRHLPQRRRRPPGHRPPAPGGRPGSRLRRAARVGTSPTTRRCSDG